MALDTKEETRNGYLVTSATKSLWSVQIELLKKLLDVCEKHHLGIWADSGTLIGCVREHGFIPWDDDIDMCMLRPDYDKLVAISQKEFTYPFFFQTAYSDVKYPRGHAQLRMHGTTAVLPVDVDSAFNLGVFIDIFVYDGVPSDPTALKELRTKAFSLSEQMRGYCKGMKISRFFSKPIAYIKHKRMEHKIDEIGFSHIFESYENLFRAYPVQQCTYVAKLTLNFDTSVAYHLKAEYFSKTIYMPFEDIQIPVPAAYDAILTRMFGDYMTPRQMPSLHGNFVLVDTNHDYTEVLTSLRKSYHRKKFIKRWKHIKDKFLYYVTFGRRVIPFFFCGFSPW